MGVLARVPARARAGERAPADVELHRRRVLRVWVVVVLPAWSVAATTSVTARRRRARARRRPELVSLKLTLRALPAAASVALPRATVTVRPRERAVSDSRSATCSLAVTRARTTPARSRARRDDVRSAASTSGLAVSGEDAGGEGEGEEPEAGSGVPLAVTCSVAVMNGCTVQSKLYWPVFSCWAPSTTDCSPFLMVAEWNSGVDPSEPVSFEVTLCGPGDCASWLTKVSFSPWSIV